MIARKRLVPDMERESFRLFYALAPDAASRAALAALARDVAAAAGGRAPRIENLHLTLAFLGSVPSARLADLAAIGAHAAVTADAFTLALDRLGLFRGAGVAWVAPQTVPAPLQRLSEALRAGLDRVGIPLEHREFRPHVTLARRATRAPVGVAAPGIRWDVDALVLMASQPGPHGVRYRELAQWRLAEPAALT